MNAIENVLVDEVLILHPDVRHPERSRVGSELLQAADGCHSVMEKDSSVDPISLAKCTGDLTS